jgi:glycosyltransferase involved in cell wall biosynthesis
MRPLRLVKYQSIVSQIAFFSIIITSHNQAHFIRDAVASAVAQAHGNKEIIVVDDASSDGSAQILEEYGDAIRLIKLGKNVGASRARNIGIAAAKGDFLVFLDGDDLLLPWALVVYNQVVDRERPHIILCTMRWFQRQIPAITTDPVPDNVEVVAYDSLLEKDRPYRASASALVISRDVFAEVQGWTNEIFPMEDLDVLIKLLSSGRTVQILAPATVCYRVHAANTVHQVANCAGALRLIIEKEKRRGYPGGQSNRARRYAFLGGPALFWLKKTYKSGLYWEALRLLALAWPMIFAAGFRRATISMRGRRAVQTLRCNLQIEDKLQI